MQTIKRMTVVRVPAYVGAAILALAWAGFLIAQPLTSTLNPPASRVVYNTNVFDDQMIVALKDSRVQVQVPSLTVSSYPSQEERFEEKLERLIAPSTVAVVANTNALDDQMIAALKESTVLAQVPSISYPSQDERYQEKLERLIAPSTVAPIASANALDDRMIAVLKESKAQAQSPSHTGNGYPSQRERYQEKLERLIASEQ